LRAGRVEDAIRHYQRALQVINPDYSKTHNALGIALFRLGKAQEAMAQYEQALQINPENVEAHNNLGTALIREGRIEDAIRHCTRALQLKPDDPDTLNNLGSALVLANRVQDAITCYERAMRIAPNDPKVYFNLGLALVVWGKGPQAIERFEQALSINPNDATVRRNLEIAANNLAWSLATIPAKEGGDPIRAVTLARRACSLTTNSAFAYLDTLAAAYASAGRFNDAVTSAQKAIELARAANQPQAANEIATRLELYRDGRAYRESKSPLSFP
jgi:tetratricopeptide (TPR) repeat protein